MTRLLRLRLLAVVACCLVFSATAHAGPVSIGFGESRSAFSLTIDGSAITRNLSYQIMIGDFWRVTASVTESVVAGEDILTVQGTARHVSAPHGEPASAFTFSFQPGGLVVPLKSIGRFSIARPTSEQLFHVNHVDSFLGRVELFGLNGQSTEYTFHLEGRHCLSTLMQTCSDLPQEEEIPEPGTLLLLGTGVAAVGIKLRRRFSGEKSGQCSSKSFA